MPSVQLFELVLKADESLLAVHEWVEHRGAAPFSPGIGVLVLAPVALTRANLADLLEPDNGAIAELHDRLGAMIQDQDHMTGRRALTPRPAIDLEQFMLCPHVGKISANFFDPQPGRCLLLIMQPDRKNFRGFVFRGHRLLLRDHALRTARESTYNNTDFVSAKQLFFLIIFYCQLGAGD